MDKRFDRLILGLDKNDPSYLTRKYYLIPKKNKIWIP